MNRKKESCHDCKKLERRVELLENWLAWYWQAYHHMTIGKDAADKFKQQVYDLRDK